MSDIQYVYPLIHNKVTSPHYVTPTLRRARLIDWLNESAECRAVVIAADAGYGKTTLLWQWEREVPFPCYWYKLDRNDRDWSLHISYLIEAISQRHAGFGRRAHSMLEQMGGPGSSRPGVAAYLLAEMHQRLTEPCTFIIDDWQFVASVTEVRGLWNQILRDAPPTCRFIFLSRAKPQLQFARFKTHGGYAEMRTDALRFNDREIDDLFRDIYNDPLDPTELAELERRTEGWAASLQLVEVSLRERRTPEERRSFIQSITATRDSDLVEYLAEEVLDQQPPQIKEFLLSTSIVQRITSDLAGRLTGHDNGADLLQSLEERGLFTYRLGSDQLSYRYHGLFRDFLERRLAAEKSQAEVAALHIHAASHFETTRSWPEAIHHYLRSGLQQHAARLIAKYGDDLATAGRLPLLDEWLQQIPHRSLRENARLSLLAGEIAGMRGEWADAIQALQRARHYFAKKGDRRMEAVACSKLSTVYNNLGDTSRCGELAREGLKLAPDDDLRTQIRLRGNLAVTVTWLESLDRAEEDCRRVAAEAAAAGLEHYAAIGYHNLGIMLMYAGRVSEAVGNLQRAAQVWDSTSASPFADNSSLVQGLLMLGDSDHAAAVAEAAVARTQPWARSHAEAWYGVALVQAHKGDLGKAIDILQRSLIEHRAALGAVREKLAGLMVECLYLHGSGIEEMQRLLTELQQPARDPRLAPMTSVAAALAAHRIGKCDGHCERASAILDRWDEAGSHLASAMGRVPLALLAVEHRPKRGARTAVRALSDLDSLGVLSYSRRWLGRFVPHAAGIADSGGDRLIPSLIRADAATWAPVAAGLIPSLRIDVRAQVLRAIEESASPEVVDALAAANGADVQEVRRRLTNRFADRVFVRSFGTMTVHRGNWSRPGILVARRRMRLVLGLMIAHYESGLTRDQVIDTLWPDSEPAAAVNSLNQTVFQLRRVITPDARDSASPQYIYSSAESLQLNTELVRTDVAEFRALATELHQVVDPRRRAGIAKHLVSLVRGEFLGDLKYEDWVAEAQIAVHSDVRSCLLPIADGRVPEVGHDAAILAGRVLTRFDPYDENAHLAIAQRLAESGRRIQARELLRSFARRIRSEFDEAPSDSFALAAARVGADVSSLEVD